MVETFLYSSATKDGCKIAVGGLCCNDVVNMCAKSYKTFEIIDFGKNKSEFFIDFMLSKYIMKFSLIHVKGVCASIQASKNGKCCGGIAGNPFNKCESANGALERIEEGIYTVAIPGMVGTVFQSDYNTAKRIHEYFLQIKNMEIMDAIKRVVLFMEEKKITFVVASDGSGENSCGIVYTSGQKWCYL
ncbi:MAG: hypothetical protein ACERLG_06535 [Sedimentibacter sp.]